MKVICAGCGLYLDERLAPGLGEEAVSHGVCDPCAIRFLAQTGVQVDEYMESLSVPAVLVTRQGTVSSANSSALTLLGKEAVQVQDRPGGEVFECMHAMLPEGCGNTIHCSGCTIRNTVMATWETGEAHMNVPAYLQQSLGGTPVRMSLLISTQMSGGLVFLRVEEIAPAELATETEAS